MIDPAAPGQDANNPETDFDRGVAALRAGNAAEAVGHFEAAIAERPDHAEALGLCGDALAALGRWDEAIARYRSALAVEPGRARFRFNLATILSNRGRHDEAVADFRRTIEAMPDLAEAHNNLAVSLHALARYPEAIAHYQKAITLKPSMPDAYSNVGNALLELGRVEEARAVFTAAIGLAPERCLHYFNLASVHRFRPNDPHLAAMERLARDIDARDAQEQMTLHYALAQAYGDLGQPERSFPHMLRANAIKRRETVYDEAAVLGEMDRIRQTFDAALMREKAGLGDPSAKPVFIVGMPRSGTTLVEQLLASHPQVYGAGELYDLDRIVQETSASRGAFPGWASEMPGAALRELGARYLAGLVVEKQNVLRVTDKMPWNFRYLGLIHLILPNARLIHVRRDPFDTCLSCFSKLFTQHQEFSYELGELGRYYRAYHALMAHWRRVLPPGAMLELRYEDLVADFEGQAQRIVAHCGLPWSEACLAFHRTPRPVRTASAAQVRRPLYRDAADRWRPYRPLAGALLEALGPELSVEEQRGDHQG